MAVGTRRIDRELAEVTRLINNRRASDIPNYNKDKIEETPKNGRSINITKRKISIGRNQLFTLKKCKWQCHEEYGGGVRVAGKFRIEYI